MRAASLALPAIAGLLLTACIRSQPGVDESGDLDPLPDSTPFDASDDAAPIVRPGGRDAGLRDMSDETDELDYGWIVEGDIGGPPGARDARVEPPPEPPTEAACEDASCDASCDRLAQCAALDPACAAIGPDDVPMLVEACLDDCAASPAMRTIICEHERCDGLMQLMRAASAEFDTWCVRGVPPDR